MTNVPRRTLGSELRGARLGYRWLDDPGVYVRISDLDNGFRLHLAPADGIPNPRRGPHDNAYRCWWETKDRDIRPELTELIRHSILGDLPRARLRSFVELDFDDDGTLRTALPH